MRIVIFLGNLGLGGTEKAACRWAWGLKQRGHEVSVVGLHDGPRRLELEQHGVPVVMIEDDASAVAGALRPLRPDVIQAHRSGLVQPWDALGLALASLPRIPVLETNIFGRLENPGDDAWIDFRLFISWTSCVQAARRAFRRMDQHFFRRASVAVYPLDPLEAPPVEDIRAFRRRLGVTDEQVLFGRLSRPEPNKWTNLALDAFRLASRRNPAITFLLREPPPEVASELRAATDQSRFRMLPATSDAAELRLTMAALDAVVHTSIIGESFGYGIAEPMNLGRPVITHSAPWVDQAQIELAQHCRCGFVASTTAAMSEAILRLAGDPELRQRMGAAARQHIRSLADPEVSLDRLENGLRAAVENRDNPLAADDLRSAQAAAAYLDAHQFGHSWAEQVALRPLHYRVRFHQWRRAIKRACLRRLQSLA